MKGVSEQALVRLRLRLLNGQAVNKKYKVRLFVYTCIPLLSLCDHLAAVSKRAKHIMCMQLDKASATDEFKSLPLEELIDYISIERKVSPNQGRKKTWKKECPFID